MAGWEQSVVQTIIQVGRQRGFSEREIVAALSTGLVESGLQNIRHGDRDSVGVFQQRPSQGWGSVNQIMDVRYAANKFYDAIDQFDKKGISGAELAARIQRPAKQYRGRYAERWSEAQNIYRQFTSGNLAAGGNGGGGISRAEGIDRSTGAQGPTSHDQHEPVNSEQMWTTILGTLADQVAGGARQPLGDLNPDEMGGMEDAGAGITAMPASMTLGADPVGDVNSLIGRTGPQPIPGQDDPLAPAPLPQPGAPETNAPSRIPGLGDLGNVQPGKGGVPKGLRSNAARGAAAARKFLGFSGEMHGKGPRPNKSDHPDGNAIDLMTYDDIKQGQLISDFYVKHAKQLGVKYVIFAKTIWSASNDWKPRRMADRGSPTANHMDHPHVSFF